MLIGTAVLFVLPGCGKREQSISSHAENRAEYVSEGMTEPVGQSTADVPAEEAEISDPGTVDSTDNDTEDNSGIVNPWYLNSTGEYLKIYNTVEDLLEDTCALVKVKVLRADSDYVRMYIYTSYEMEVLDVVYGALEEDGDTILVNVPGGILRGEKLQNMLAEVTAGKDSELVGDLSGITEQISGDVDRMLSAGDEAYLFLIKESDTSYALVAEDGGEAVIEGDNVLFSEMMMGFQNGVSTYGWHNRSMTESDFLEAIGELIVAKTAE